MTELISTMADKIDRTMQRVIPLAYRVRRTGRRLVRRALRKMGMAAQAIDIVYQLNASEESDPSIYQHGASPLESLSFGGDSKTDIILRNLAETDRLMAFRYHDLILLKNYSGQNVSVRGRPLVRGGFGVI